MSHPQFADGVAERPIMTPCCDKASQTSLFLKFPNLHRRNAAGRLKKPGLTSRRKDRKLWLPKKTVTLLKAPESASTKTLHDPFSGPPHCFNLRSPSCVPEPWPPAFVVSLRVHFCEDQQA